MVRDVMLAVSESGLARCWQQATGSAFRKGQLITYGVIGGGDISGIVKGCGKRLEIEIKTGKAKQSKQQQSFEKMITAFGGIYILARSPKDAIDQLSLKIDTSFLNTLSKTS